MSIESWSNTLSQGWSALGLNTVRADFCSKVRDRHLAANTTQLFLLLSSKMAGEEFPSWKSSPVVKKMEEVLE